MDVRIDDSRHDDGIARIVNVRGISRVLVRGNSTDAAIGQVNGGGARSFRRDDTPPANDCQAVSAQKRRRRFIDTRLR